MIQNIVELRNFALETLEKLASGKISIEEAGVTGKLCENVVSTIKAQLEFAKALERYPKIDFLNGSTEEKLAHKTMPLALGET